MKCIFSAGFQLTEGNTYNILDTDSTSDKVKVLDNCGSTIWVGAHCFL